MTHPTPDPIQLLVVDDHSLFRRGLMALLAQDPRFDSVTKAFYDMGWRGINLEPVAHWFDLLEADRPRDLNLRLAAASSEGRLTLHEIDLENGAVLETGCVYIVPLMESLDLPADISASANPKSSTGRLDIFTRVMVDYAQEFDKVPAGYKGPLYLPPPATATKPVTPAPTAATVPARSIPMEAIRRKQSAGLIVSQSTSGWLRDACSAVSRW